MQRVLDPPSVRHNPDAESCIFGRSFIHIQVALWFVCPGSSNCYVIYVQLLYWYKIIIMIIIIDNFKFRPFLLRCRITIQWLPVIHSHHSLSFTAKINTVL